MNLALKHRPKTWAEVVGQDKAIGQIKSVIDHSGVGGQVWWLSGQSGTGKTTLAYLIAGEIADPICTEELDASELTPARLVEVEQQMHYYGWGSGGRAYIVNEAHGLRRDAIRQLLVLLERIPAHCTMIFTTTCDGQDSLFEDHIDACPLLSRCHQIALGRRDLAKAFAARAQEIARSEGLDGRPLAEYCKLAQQCRNNMRSMLLEIESGRMKQ